MDKAKDISHYLIFVTASLALILSGIGGTAITVAFPVFITEFDTNLIVAGWVLNIYQLISTVAMPLAGKVSEIFGRKRTFMFCLAFWAVGSLFAALSPNIYLLIIARLIQSIGGGGFLPTASGIVAEEFIHSRQQVIGLFSSVFAMGQIIGPNLGGWLVTSFGWQSIFWLNVPLSIFALIAAAFLLKGEPRKEGGIDLVGTGLSTGAISALLLGLSGMGYTESAFSWIRVGLLLITAIVLIIVFLHHEHKVKDPIIDIALLKERPFMASNYYGFVLGAAYFGISSFIPLYAVSVYGMSILQSGLLLTPMWLGLMIASIITSISLAKWGYRRPILIGSCFMIFSTILLGMEFFNPGATPASPSAMILLLIIMALTGFGMGIVFPAANNACIELMPDRVATIAGLRGTFRQAGGALIIAVITLVLHNMGNIVRGFQFVFLGLAVLIIISLPTIFFMPASCQVTATTSANKHSA